MVCKILLTFPSLSLRGFYYTGGSSCHPNIIQAPRGQMSSWGSVSKRYSSKTTAHLSTIPIIISLSKNINQGPVPTPQGHCRHSSPFQVSHSSHMSLRPKVSDSRPSVFTSFFPPCPSACDPDSPPRRRSQELTRKARTLPFPPVSSPGSPHSPSAASHQAESKIKARTRGR